MSPSPIPDRLSSRRDCCPGRAGLVPRRESQGSLLSKGNRSLGEEMGGEGAPRRGGENKQIASRRLVTSPPIPPAIPPCCIFWISQFIYFTFLAPSPRSMPIQYLFKHYFMPLARETFTFKFSNIPQSLVCKQHISVLQLFPLSKAVGIKPSHAQRKRRGRGPRTPCGHRTAR